MIPRILHDISIPELNIIVCMRIIKNLESSIQDSTICLSLGLLGIHRHPFLSMYSMNDLGEGNHLVKEMSMSINQSWCWGWRIRSMVVITSLVSFLFIETTTLKPFLSFSKVCFLNSFHNPRKKNSTGLLINDKDSCTDPICNHTNWAFLNRKFEDKKFFLRYSWVPNW